MGFTVFWAVFGRYHQLDLSTRRGWLVIDWNNFIFSFLRHGNLVASLEFMKRIVAAIKESGFRVCIVQDGKYQNYERQIDRLERMAKDLIESVDPRRWSKKEAESESLRWSLFSVAKDLFKEAFQGLPQGKLNADGVLSNPGAEFVFVRANKSGEADTLIRKFARRYAGSVVDFLIVSRDASLILGVPVCTCICPPEKLIISGDFISTLINLKF
jgi:tetrahydromethanopterin S-methyltransferase subunit B